MLFLLKPHLKPWNYFVSSPACPTGFWQTFLGWLPSRVARRSLIPRGPTQENSSPPLPPPPTLSRRFGAWGGEVSGPPSRVGGCQGDGMFGSWFPQRGLARLMAELWHVHRVPLPSCSVSAVICLLSWHGMLRPSFPCPGTVDLLGLEKSC